MLYHTGMRIGEVQTRKWSDINWINRDIYVHDNWDEKNHLLSEDTKNGKHRHVLLNKILVKGLRKNTPEIKILTVLMTTVISSEFTM